MASYIPPAEFAEFMAKADGRASDKDALDSTNVGHRLLQKMGWREGEGLGKLGEGMTAPVEATIKSSKGGIGLDTGEVSAADDHFTKYKKLMMLAYKHRAGQ